MPQRAKAVMVLGTGSGVGKSFITAGLCRILSDEGIRAAPFKAQNMSNNSFVTKEGYEMARAQAVQAQCARVEPDVHMNPILLKPSADNLSQVIVHGKVCGTFGAREYYSLQEKMWKAIQDSYERLSREYEMLVIEGAGSPAEINLKNFDMVNFRVAELADAQCVLVGDIDRGGVFAWLWGTLTLLENAECDRISGLIINKFRGDIELLEPGLQMLESLSHKKVLGVLPYNFDLWLEEEDALNLERSTGLPSDDHLDIAVLLLPRISNATDFQILAEERGVSVRMVKCLEEWGSPDLLILPGTKATQSDMNYLRERGFAKKIKEYTDQGGRILGICGGFQMLGEVIEDPQKVESGIHSVVGLGLLPLRTVFSAVKTLKQVRGDIRGKIFSYPVQGEIQGYEIHMGQTEIGGDARALFEICGEESTPWRPEGAIDPSGKIFGTYLHGLFDHEVFRGSFLNALRQSVGKKSLDLESPTPSIPLVKEKNYDKLARFMRQHLNLNFLEACSHSSSHLV